MSDYTPEQVERAAERLCVRSRDDLEAERMLRAYAATLRQQGGQAGGAVSDEAVQKALNAELDGGTVRTAFSFRDPEKAMRAALDAVVGEYSQTVEFDLRKWVRHMAEVLEAGKDVLGVDADLARLGAAIQAALAQNTQGEAVTVGPASWPSACAWPAKPFTVRDEPGEHDPCWLVLPDNAMLAFVHHAANGVDQARAQFIADVCNAYTHAERATVPDGHVLVPKLFVDKVQAACRAGTHPLATVQLIEEALEALAAAPSQPAERATAPELQHREWHSALTLAAETLEVEQEHMAEGGHDDDARRMKRAATVIRSLLAAAPSQPEDAQS